MPALLTEGSLKEHRFLQGSSEEFLNKLAQFSRDVSFEPGELILTEHGYADRCYLLVNGTVRLEAGVNGWPPFTVQILGPGDIVGLSWLYPPFQWNFSARAIDHCDAIELNAASLLIRAEENPAFGYELLKKVSMQLVQRLQATRRRLVREMRARQESQRAPR